MMNKIVGRDDSLALSRNQQTHGKPWDLGN